MIVGNSTSPDQTAGISSARIALARHYHNDSLLALQDRLKTFPDVLVAKLFRFKPGKRLPSLQDADELARAPSISLDEEEQIKPDA